MYKDTDSAKLFEKIHCKSILHIDQETNAIHNNTKMLYNNANKRGLLQQFNLKKIISTQVNFT